MLGCCVGLSAAIALLPRGCCREGCRTEARLVNRRRRLSARPCARRHHHRVCRGKSGRRGGYRPAIGDVEVCTPEASHDDGKLLEGSGVGRRDATRQSRCCCLRTTSMWLSSCSMGASSECGVGGSGVLVFDMHLPRLMMRFPTPKFPRLHASRMQGLRPILL